MINKKSKKKIKKPRILSKNMKNKKKAVISYNISWATQDNIEAGSEKNFVKFCKQKSNKLSYNDTNYKKLSYCTNNVAIFLSSIAKKYDLEIIGFQEPSDNSCATCNSNSKRNNILLIKNIMNREVGRNIYKIIKSKKFGKAFSAIIYHINLGRPKIIAEIDLSKGRPLQIIFFKKTGYLVINGHFPHNLDITQYLDIFDRINDLVKSNLDKYKLTLDSISRIIFTGDFNDHKNNLNEDNKQIIISDFLGKDLVCGNGKDSISRTCCYHPKTYTIGPVKSVGDYILDSEVQHYFGVPREYNKSLPHSDHLPVIGISK